MPYDDWLDPSKLATQFAPGVNGQQVPVRDPGAGTDKLTPWVPAQQPPQQPPQQQQAQQQPQQNAWQQPPGGQQAWQGPGDWQGPGGTLGRDPFWQMNFGSNQIPTADTALQDTWALYQQGNSTVNDFLNGLNGGGQGGGFGGGGGQNMGGIMPNMGGIMPQGLPDPNAAGGGSGSGIGGSAGGWGGWGSPPTSDYGFGPTTTPNVNGGINGILGNIDMSGLGDYGPDNTMGLGLSAMLLGQVPPPGQDMMPTPGQRNYESGITGGQMDPAQLAGIRAPLAGGLSMPNLPGMNGDQMGALSSIFGQAGSDEMANQRNAYDMMAAGQGSTLENNRMQALADAGLQGQQFGINRELQDLRRFNTGANQDNQLQQSAIQMIIAALGGL